VAELADAGDLKSPED